MKISKNIILAITACALWSSAFVGIKIGQPYSTPLNFAGLRFIIAGILVFIGSGNYKKNLTVIITNYKVVIIVGILQTFFVYLFFYKGLEVVDGATGAIVTGFSPLWGTVFSHFLTKNDKLTLKKIFAFIVGITGIIIVTLGSKKYSVNFRTYGVLFLVMSSLISGIVPIVVHKKKDIISAFPLNSGQLILGGTLLFFISFFTEKVILPKNFTFYLSLAYLSVLSAIAFSIWYYLLQGRVKISELNIWKFIIPVLGSVLSWLLLKNEHPTLISILGIIAVAGGVFLYYKE